MDICIWLAKLFNYTHGLIVYWNTYLISQFSFVLSFIFCFIFYGGMEIMGFLMFSKGTLSQITLKFPKQVASSKLAVLKTASHFATWCLLLCDHIFYVFHFIGFMALILFYHFTVITLCFSYQVSIHLPNILRGGCNVGL